MPFNFFDDPFDPIEYLIFEDVTRDKDSDDWDDDDDDEDSDLE